MIEGPIESGGTLKGQSAKPRGNQKLLRLVVIGLICLLVGLGVRHFLLAFSDESSFDTSPLPRQPRNAPFITTGDAVVEKMVQLAGLTKDDLVYDLGCGDGRIVITAALESGCRGVGFDIDPLRVSEARENARLHGVEDRVTIEEQDVFKLDLGKADKVMMYLLPWMMNGLLPQLDQMKPGARIVSHEFWIEGVEPDGFVEMPIDEGGKMTGIYVYNTPLRKNPLMEKGKPPR